MVGTQILPKAEPALCLQKLNQQVQSVQLWGYSALALRAGFPGPLVCISTCKVAPLETSVVIQLHRNITGRGRMINHNLTI